MPTLTRHGKATANPADYEIVGEFYQGASDEIAREYQHDAGDILDATPNGDWAEVGAPDGHYRLKGSCDACGAAFAYGVVFRHLPTGDLVAVGHTCANHFAAEDVWTANRNLAEARARKAKERFDTRAANFARYGHALRAVWNTIGEIATDTTIDEDGWITELTAYDIAMKATRGDQLLSDRAARFMVRKARGALTAKQQREAEAARTGSLVEPVEEGKRQIDGNVVRVYWKDDEYYGGSFKMIVEEANGNRLWGTAPAKLLDTYPGLESDCDGVRIQFTATVTRSDRDPHFGFFKRPSKVVPSRH